MIRRRHAILGLGVATSSPVWSQMAARRPLVAYLGGVRPDAGTRRTMVEPFLRGMRELGYVDGRSVTIEYRWADGRPERLPELLAELVAMKPDVLVAAGPRPALLARDGAPGIPVVAVAVDDPVRMGLAASITRPGGQITGLSGAFSGILEKRLQLMKDILPGARRFGILMNPLTNPREGIARDAPEWERRLGVGIVLAEARGPDEFDAAFETLAKGKAEAVAILADASFYSDRVRLGELCAKHRLPAVVGGRDYLDAVGLVSYQGDFAALFRRAGVFVDKILKGTTPGEIPFEQSSKLELVVNLATARTLGLRIPPSVLVSADEVIE